ncbi:MAG: porphobilinogen synthase [candidate division Zixibacteria bacterium]|nr:porphobilinogen synthase [candidate division Zixibacteria bacterium]
MSFPFERPRRLRKSVSLRNLVRETRLHPHDFILPLFVTTGKGKKEPIPTLPGCFRYSPDNLTEVVREAESLHVPAIILFGIPDKKDSVGSESWKPDSVVSQAIKAVKDSIGDMTVIADVCLCEYTDHGHCGVYENGEVKNDATVELLAKQAVSFAQAGADIVAPSDMMDGRVEEIRFALDEEGLERTAILSYTAKYCSAFYGPFRDAADSAPQEGDRSGYQMDPANVREAVREVQLDIDESADMVMVKPALAYLDVISEVRQFADRPLLAYNVSGEYAMVKAAAANGWADEKRMTMEILTSIKRSGADAILTYHAIDASRWIIEELTNAG